MKLTITRCGLGYIFLAYRSEAEQVDNYVHNIDTMKMDFEWLGIRFPEEKINEIKALKSGESLEFLDHDKEFPNCDQVVVH